MFAGHVGAAMAIARVERRINLGWFVLAALGLDAVLWSLVLLGWEQVTIPADFARRHQPEFVFPWSHGLLASLAWSALAGVAAWWGTRAWRVALCIAAAVFSHWLLDALVHAPELPLAGAGSPRLGLGLWNTLPIALALEALIAVAGCWLYVAACGLSRGRIIGLVLLAAFVLASTIAGMTLAPAPPSAAAMAASSLATIIVVAAVAGWLARR